MQSPVPVQDFALHSTRRQSGVSELCLIRFSYSDLNNMILESLRYQSLVVETCIYIYIYICIMHI